MRKTKQVVIEGDPATNRDVGKTFEITEMPAWQAEEWSMRALSAMGRGSVDIPPDIMSRGMAAWVIIGVKAFAAVPFAEAKPLLAEMMDCVAMVPNPGQLARLKGEVMMGQIEEVSTILLLRDEVMQLHVGFSVAAEISKMREAALQAISAASQNTPTSPDTSEPS